MKTVISATLIALMLALAAPALADRDRGYYSYRGHHDYRGSHYRRDWDRHQWRGHKYDRRYHAPRYYRGGDRYIIHRSEEHTSELQSREKFVCRLLPDNKSM